MKPETQSKQLLSITQSKAKMYEYGVEEEYHIRIPRDPSKLFTLTIGLLGEYSSYINSGNTNEKYIVELRENLRFAASFFDSYLQSNLGKNVDNYLLLLGSAAYYLCDLPGSSRVLANRIQGVKRDLECANLDILLTWLLRGDFSKSIEITTGIYNTDINRISFKIHEFFEFGTNSAEEIKGVVARLRDKAYQGISSRELLFADIINAVIIKIIENSSWNCLPLYTGIDIEKWSVTLKSKNVIKEFWPAQHLLGQYGVLKGTSAVVQLPTSAGKTKATELIIRSAFLSERTSVAIIVAPFRALCNEISNSLLISFKGEHIYIDELSDVPQLDFDFDKIFEGKHILVVTPEKLLYVLRHYEELSEQVGLIIYDEGHQFDNGKRGTNYELLLTSLNNLLLETTQKVLISAVISNASSIGSWLQKDNMQIVSGVNISPTHRTIAFTSWRDYFGRLEFVDKDDPDKHEFFVPRIIEQYNLELKGRETKKRVFPDKEDSNSIALYLGLKLVSNGSIAIFCGKKVTASKLCEKIIDCYNRGLKLTKPLDFSNQNEVKKLSFLYECHLGSDNLIVQSAKIGIFTHHGNIPHGVRNAVEHAMKEELIKFVICTSTLAQGVNLPMKYLIVTSLYQGGEEIKVRDFHNLIGRVGRSGMHTEGSILFADPNIYDKGREIKREKWRWKQVKKFLNPKNSEPCSSSLLVLFEPLYSVDRKFEYEIDILKFIKAFIEDSGIVSQAVEKMATLFKKEGYTEESLHKQFINRLDVLSSIESFLMAHWDSTVNGMDEEKITNLAKGTLAYYLTNEQNKEKVIEVFKLLALNISQNVPNNSQKRVYGKTLYGLQTAIEIEQWINYNNEVLKNCKSFSELLDLIWPLLMKNITNKLVKNCEQPDILKDVAIKWINGDSFSDLYSVLETNDVRIKSKKQRTKLKMDHTVEICENVFSYEIPLLIGAICEITESKEENQYEDIVNYLRKLQKMMKYGLPTSLSIMIWEIGFSDRVVSIDLESILTLYTSTQASKRRLIKVIKEQNKLVRECLEKYPSYFGAVLNSVLNN